MDPEQVAELIEAQRLNTELLLEQQAKSTDLLVTKLFDGFKTYLTSTTGTSSVPPAGPITTSATTTEYILNSLSSRIPEFIFDEESGQTFDVWYQRYQDTLSKDAKALDDDARSRFILQKLDPTSYARFINHILPKRPADLAFEETVGTLRTLFGPSASLFSRRMAYTHSKWDGQSIRDYTGLINSRHELAEMNSISSEQLKLLIWLSGLDSQKHSDLRSRALRLIEEKSTITLKELSADVQHILDIRKDSLIRSTDITPTGINAISKLNNTKRDPPSPCYRCGGQHWAKDCSFITQKCTECSRFGHKAGFCQKNPPKKNKSKRQTNAVDTSTSPRTSEDRTSIGKFQRIFKIVKINGKSVKMRLDTGADISILNKQDWITLGRPELSPPLFDLKSANQQPINVYGFFRCKFDLDGQTGEGTCHVADSLTLLGMDWIVQNDALYRSLNGTAQINSVSVASLTSIRENVVERLRTLFPDTFTEGLGCCSKTKAVFHLKPDVTPIFRKARPVSYASLPLLSAEIERLVATSVLRPVEHSDWASPIVCVKKKNGKIRLCADYSTGLNDRLQDNQHPLPLPEEIFNTLNGGRYFSTIDFSEAYLQVEVADESKHLTTINTHLGLFEYERMPFGMKTAPGIFQSLVDSMTSGLTEHNSRLEKLFDRIHAYGLRIGHEKCSFLTTETRFLGFIIDKSGRRPDPAKIEAISKMPAPTDTTQVRALLGMIQFYGQFIRSLHDLRAPLDALTKKDVIFKWTPECQSALDKIKAKLLSNQLLVHFDPELRTIVAGDASQYGVGAVLLHEMPDGSYKAVAHASRTLTPAQKGYSQTEKEALALVFAMQKFHRYVHGRKFTLRTDHRPLLSIFGSKTGIPVHSANRLQRWALILLNYDFEIEYINTQNFGYADALSRLIAAQQLEEEDRVIASIEADVTADFAANCNSLPVTSETIQKATIADPLLVQVSDHIQSGQWPKIKPDSPLWHYYNRRESLTMVQNCLLFSDRIIIPKTLQNRVLQNLHKAHPGQTRMKMLARSFVYWPNIDSQIEQLVRNCPRCASAAKNPVKTELKTWPTPNSAWTRVHADFAGPMNGTYYLVIVDAFSRWPEIFALKQITTSATISVLRQVFSRFGNPTTLVTDNGTQFTSAAFENFCTSNGIEHLRSPPYHPQSNGLAERFVDTLKRSLLKLQGEERTADTLQTFLQVYRSSPCPSNTEHRSPAELFLQRTIRTPLSLMKPTVEQPRLPGNTSAENQFNRHHGARHRKFDINDAVFVRDFRDTKSTWIPGIVINRHGNVKYTVRADGHDWIRHINHMRPRDNITAVNSLLDDFDLPLFPKAESPQPQPVILPLNSPPPLRRSTRIRKPATRLVIEPHRLKYRVEEMLHPQ
ncbi:unnamed protein product [Caenorhabditis angaria]|uniref:RNA-directed DNA polymerase n=1 Tax=Caenorhabditis angaria TaxID=860376 RepID=A0A9P1IJQ2_9PELO|nr:unnamed protein product [Caenorhabditis angaria]